MASAPNGSLRFTRFPLEVIASAAPGSTRLGIGVTIHFAPSFSCDVSDICNGNIAFDQPSGVLFQIAHYVRRGANGGIDFGARYTRIEYTIRGARAGTPAIDGSSFGVFLGARL